MTKRTYADMTDAERDAIADAYAHGVHVEDIVEKANASDVVRQAVRVSRTSRAASSPYCSRTRWLPPSQAEQTTAWASASA
jgi:hypothetical protein